jgi:phage terminase large subunit GpA-like protein
MLELRTILATTMGYPRSLGKTTTGEHITDAAKLYCPHCDHGHDDKHRLLASQAGYWIPKFPDREIKSYHLTAILSPWVKLKDLAAKFVEAAHKPSLLRTFLNTDLGQVWDDDLSSDVQQIDFLLRCEDYSIDVIPNAVLFLTAALDVQDDRLECEVLGWGLNEETWSLEHHIIAGSPGTLQVWRLLEEYLVKKYRREDGVELRVITACIDSGGHHTQQVYNFTARNFSKRWFATKGHKDFNAPAWPKKRTRTTLGQVYVVGSSAIKEMLYEYLKNDQPGTYGYCHFPSHYLGDYFKQLFYFVRSKYLRQIMWVSIMSCVDFHGV